MQNNSNSPWRSPAPDYPSKQFNLQHTASMANLHEEPFWRFSNRGPPSPAASSVSSATSRSTTPTMAQCHDKNPWSSVMTSPSSTISTQSTNSSPKDSPNRTPQYTSRSTTPVAPQPIRPIHPSTGFVPMSPPASSVGEGFRDYPGSPIQNFPGSPNPYRQAAASVSPLVNGFLNRALLSSQGTSLSGWFYNLSRQQGWETSLANNIWHWTVSNPRLALLLVVCDDVASWRQAKFFDLRDENLPFPEDRLQGIVGNPRKVVDEQWRATSKELPLNGAHIDFAARETVPMQQISLIKTSRSSEKIVDGVRMLGNHDDRILVRKRFVVTRSTQKATILKQINDFKQLDHKNIAKLLCSYSQPSHVGIATVRAQYSLDDYLALPSGDSVSNRSKVLLDWMHDLSQALEYLHSQSICHRSIRPRKILIDGGRIFFAPFGIGQSSDIISPTAANSQRLDQLHAYFQDQSYVFAAPEAVATRGKRPADVFSLGCVFLSMMTVIQNQSLSLFTQYRAGSSQDASFQAHLDRVGSWRTRLHASATAGLRNGVIGSGRKQRQLKSEVDWLQIIERMILAESKERIKVARLTAILAKLGDGKATGGRRRSLDAGGYSGQAAAALGIVTGNINGNMSGIVNGNSSGSGNNSGSGNGGNGSPMSGIIERQPELSLFNHYFQQQQDQQRQKQQDQQRQKQQDQQRQQQQEKQRHDQQRQQQQRYNSTQAWSFDQS
jgi:serine/threonine protein kinase